MQQGLSISASNTRQKVVSRNELATSPGYVSTERAKLEATHLTANTFRHTLIPIKLRAESLIFCVNLLKTFFPFAIRISLLTSSQFT
jgi:hypothetical protein